MKKFRSIFVLVIMTLLMFTTSCSDGSQSTYDILNELSLHLSSTQDDSSQPQGELIIIIPDGCSADVVNAAETLSDTMSKFVGYDIDCKYNSEHAVNETNFEILVGNTKRAQSKEYMRSLRTYDYGFQIIDSSLVIGAHKNEKLCAAITELCNKFNSEEYSPLYPMNIKPYIVSDTYTVSSFKLNGFRLSEYTLVYPAENTLYEKEIANIFSSYIENKYGYTLYAQTDNEVAESARKLCIGKTKFSNTIFENPNAKISSNGALIEFLANDSYGIQCALSDFSSMLEVSINNNVGSLEYIGQKDVPYDSSEISFMVFDNTSKGYTSDMFHHLTSDAMSDSISCCAYYGFDQRGVEHISNNLGYDYSKTAFSTSVFALNNSYSNIETTQTDVEGGTITVQKFKRNTDNIVLTFIYAFGDGDNEASLLSSLKNIYNTQANKYTVVINNMGYEADTQFALSCDQISKISTELTTNIYIKSSLISTSASTKQVYNAFSADKITLKIKL